jgi:hypothetical protein
VKVGDVIRIPAGARKSFKMKSGIGVVVGTLPREDHYPNDFEVMVDGLVHAMGFTLQDSAEVISESR